MFTVTVDLLTNGGFEAGVAPWVQKQSGLINSTATHAARTGVWKAQLLGTGASANHWIYQQPPFPAVGVPRTLTFYLRIVTSEGTGAMNDKLGVRIFNSSNQELAVLQMFSNQDQATYANYTLVTIAIPANLAVSGNRIRFGANENGSLPTTFLIDDVSIQ
jgi:hypothetical protein